jgi:hypothetical protein
MAQGTFPRTGRDEATVARATRLGLARGRDENPRIAIRAVPDVVRGAICELEAVGRRCQVASNSAQADVRGRAEHHASEAERLLKSRLLSSHVKAQAHATLAVYYSARHTADRASD